MLALWPFIIAALRGRGEQPRQRGLICGLSLSGCPRRACRDKRGDPTDEQCDFFYKQICALIRKADFIVAEARLHPQFLLREILRVRQKRDRDREADSVWFFRCVRR